MFGRGKCALRGPARAFTPVHEQHFLPKRAMQPTSYPLMSHGADTIYRKREKLHWFQRLCFLVGLPVETRQSVTHRKPVLTWFLIIFISSISIAFWYSVGNDPNHWMRLFIFRPSNTGINWLFGLVGYGFLHGDIFHLLGNMYFLMIFGDNVECRFGRWRMIGLLLFSSMVGAYFHGMFSTTGLVGASSAIFGLVVFYVLQFPKARVLWLPFGIVTRFIFLIFGSQFASKGLPAWFFLVLYGGLQFFILASSKEFVG